MWNNTIAIAKNKTEKENKKIILGKNWQQFLGKKEQLYKNEGFL